MLHLCYSLIVPSLALLFGQASGAEPPVDVDQLIKQLGSEKFEEREAASKALEGISGPALLPLQDAANGDSDPEVRQRAAVMVRVIQAREHDGALARIKRLGSRVDVDREIPGWPVVLVYFPEKATDRDLAAIQFFPELRRLSVQKAGVTDAGLKQLRGLRKLETLDLLGCSKITGEGLKHLSRMSSLKRLDLSETQVGDEALRHLRQFPRLEWLDLISTRVTDAGLAHLKTLPSLRELWVGNCEAITDKALTDLKKALPKLETDR
jgi:hypothetical protein